jgi:hypothetical protein
VPGTRTRNRISSSGRHGSDSFRLDQRARPVPRVRRCTSLNCNPNCNPQIRRSGHVVQDRPSMLVGWADIPELSTCVGCCSAPWLQSWLQSRRNGADPRPSAFQAGHIPVGADRASVMRCRRSLLLTGGWCCCCHGCCQPRSGDLTRRLRPRTTAIVVPCRVHRICAWHLPAPAVVLGPRPSPHRTDCCRSIRRRGGVKGRFACTSTRHFHLCSLPGGQIGPCCRTGGVSQSGGSLVGGLCSFHRHPGPGGHRRTCHWFPRSTASATGPPA